ncbi:hypothetical protein ISO55_17850 [Morganella morganii subsp. morganii]|uniref:hypothetical protein n=1 Tax=Morganella morganii TaxID=582 RepID=UPI001BD92C66|nr:hypothetical protein [Morganella morganii]MBT0368813.1 hypothetical protein [Morganella morganii subsp. morganii]
MSKPTNTALISKFVSLKNKEVNTKQAKMIDELNSMGLLVTPSFGLKCTPSAYFQPRSS